MRAAGERVAASAAGRAGACCSACRTSSCPTRSAFPIEHAGGSVALIGLDRCRIAIVVIACDRLFEAAIGAAVRRARRGRPCRSDVRQSRRAAGVPPHRRFDASPRTVDLRLRADEPATSSAACPLLAILRRRQRMLDRALRLAFVVVLVVFTILRPVPAGDAHAYWVVDLANPYTRPVATQDAFTYPPPAALFFAVLRPAAVRGLRGDLDAR